MINESISWLNDNGSAVTASATAALAIITLFYVVQLKKERHERVKPILAVRKLVGCFESVKIPNKEEMLCVVIENIGRGHAFDISFDCLFGSSLERKKISIETIKHLIRVQYSTGKTTSKKIFYKESSRDIPTGFSINHAKYNFSELLIKIKYKDELGKKYKKTEYINFHNVDFLRNSS